LRLLFATKDLAVDGRSYEGMPLILDNDCWPLEPAQSFLWHLLTAVGAAESELTWEAYGRGVYDFFAFLAANNLPWDRAVLPGQPSVVAHYKDWSLGELELSRKTVNQRLRLVVRFYEWARANDLISTVPFGYREVRISRAPGLLAHLGSQKGTIAKPAILSREHKAPPKFATKEQVQACRAVLRSSSQRLLFELMVRVGLRSCEARTFPLKYVFDPKTRTDLRKGQMLRVNLDPADMWLKFGKERSVDIPWTLMEDLWAYSTYERQVRQGADGKRATALILSTNGTTFARSSVVSVFEALEKKVGFHIRAHMLRHTYGTYTLAKLRKSKDFEGEPLLYVRDRMGHSDVQTTAIYLHLINQLEAQLVLAHEDEIDHLFRLEPDAVAEST
jgi:integrase/recombinase XerD